MKTSPASTVLGTATMMILAACSFSKAQDPGPPGPGTIPVAVNNDQPAFMVRAEVNHASHEYQAGDALSVRAISEVDAYLYVHYQQADGKRYQIFPNRQQPNNKVRAKEWVSIPGDDDLFRWVVSAPYGKEVVWVLASRTPIADLDNPALRQERFNPVPPAQVQTAQKSLLKGPPAKWAESATEIVTTERRAGTTGAAPKRFAVFIGLAEYKFDRQRVDGLRLIVSPDKKDEIRPLQLPGCDNDAKRMEEELTKLGKLDGMRLLVNAQATRAGIEEAITRWLPQVSKPGDTVFIFHSGHGGQVPDDNGDEADKKDEILITNDFVSIDTILGASVLAKKQNIPLGPELESLRSQALEKFGDQPDPKQESEKFEKWISAVDEFLERQTGISDDLFGHWIQKLDGRQVVVILDTCFSGGFYTKEQMADKGIGDDEKAPQFDYVDQEIGRLKDIGQRNTALLAACAANQLSAVRIDKPISVMTFALLVQLTTSKGPIELRQAYEGCVVGMKIYFDSLREKLPPEARAKLKEHQPTFYADLAHPAFLRP